MRKLHINGWTNGTLDFTGSETDADPNPDNDFTVTLSACWVQSGTYVYDYTGSSQTFTTPCNGYYKIEAWGAQGGYASTTHTYRGGYGGYSTGVYNTTKNQTLYINIGGQGSYCTSSSTCSGGYNGGLGAKRLDACDADVANIGIGGGGGATSIATVSGLLSSLEAYKGDLVNGQYYDSAYILMVAGGGGGGNYCNSVNYARGGSGGGASGVNSVDIGAEHWAGNGGGSATGGTQISGSSFGQAINISSTLGWIGGGGGFYGGRNSRIGGGGGGSGYIGSSNLISTSSLTKHMTCYSCTTSTIASTYTISNTNVSSTATSDYSKSGNGYAKIQYLGPTL